MNSYTENNARIAKMLSNYGITSWWIFPFGPVIILFLLFVLYQVRSYITHVKYDCSIISAGTVHTISIRNNQVSGSYDLTDVQKQSVLQDYHDCLLSKGVIALPGKDLFSPIQEN